MPHITIKLHPGRSDTEKQALAHAITAAMGDAMGYAPGTVSIGLTEIEPSDWMSEVYWPDIVRRSDTLLRRPGYGPLAMPEPDADRIFAQMDAREVTP